jgi:hypothetical protein
LHGPPPTPNGRARPDIRVPASQSQMPPSLSCRPDGEEMVKHDDSASLEASAVKTCIVTEMLVEIAFDFEPFETQAGYRLFTGLCSW